MIVGCGSGNIAKRRTLQMKYHDYAYQLTSEDGNDLGSVYVFNDETNPKSMTEFLEEKRADGFGHYIEVYIQHEADGPLVHKRTRECEDYIADWYEEVA